MQAEVYFAWVNPEDTTFNSVAYARRDEQFVSFELSQQEGDFAILELRIKNPRVGLLSSARKVWGWFSWDIGAGIVPLFFGRLVGIPTDIFGEVVTLELIARPADFTVQKVALAESLKELPYYDPIFHDSQSRDDYDTVLDAYAAVWHIDRVTHALTISGYLDGEDGTETFLPSEMRHDGLSLNLNSVPLTSVEMDALLPWTQLGTGTVDISSHILANWPNESVTGMITSFTLRENNWPQAGTSIGDNWKVFSSTCPAVYDLEVKHQTSSGRTIFNWWDGVTTDITTNTSDDYLTQTPPGSIAIPAIFTQDTTETRYQDDDEGGREIASYNSNAAWTNALVALGYFIPTLQVEYDAQRPFEEHVTFTMIADVQRVVTDAGEDEVLRLEMRAVNLSEPLDDTSGAEVPIGDTRRRAYIKQSRGLQSLEYLIALASAHLLRRSRVVEITFAPVLSRFTDISLRKTAIITDPRLPGGTAEGKIIGYRCVIDGDTGQVDFKVTMGCAIGQGGEVVAVTGTPLYVEEGYVEDGYQEYDGRISALNNDVGYEPPQYAPNDDGIDFFAGLTADDTIETPLSVAPTPAQQRALIEADIDAWLAGLPPILDLTPEQMQEILNSRTEAINNSMKSHATVATFKLKPMRKEFLTDVPVAVTQLKIPKMINLEAAS